MRHDGLRRQPGVQRGASMTGTRLAVARAGEELPRALGERQLAGERRTRAAGTRTEKPPSPSSSSGNAWRLQRAALAQHELLRRAGHPGGAAQLEHAVVAPAPPRRTVARGLRASEHRVARGRPRTARAPARPSATPPRPRRRRARRARAGRRRSGAATTRPGSSAGRRPGGQRVAAPPARESGRRRPRAGARAWRRGRPRAAARAAFGAAPRTSPGELERVAGALVAADRGPRRAHLRAAARPSAPA